MTQPLKENFTHKINLFKKYKKQILEFKTGNEYIQKIDEILIDNFT